MEITSDLFSLKKIVEQRNSDWRFNVPIYQRLYVWGSDQIGLLLTDIANAYDRNEEHFFIGGALMVEKTTPEDEREKVRRFDLIDGQQRFTTLWLLSCVSSWGEALEPFRSIKDKEGEKPRIHFAIRHKVNKFLADLLQEGSDAFPEHSTDTQSLAHAQNFMRSFANKHKRPQGAPVDSEYLAKLSRYIFKNVKFVVTQVPEGMDLNKLFEVINNRGVQLQHHDILKARLLQDIPREDQSRYAALWNACADMSGFVERNLCAETGLEASHLGRLYSQGELTSIHHIHRVLKNHGKQKGVEGESGSLTLKAILDGDAEDFESPEDDSERDGEVWARSIIGFPLFLQHVLRIWLYKRGKEDLPRLLDRKLLSMFDDHYFAEIGEDKRAGNAQRFINLLWRIRVLWDDYIIKWIDQGDDEIQQICLTSISKSNGKQYINRSRDNTSSQEFSLLQGMLYHSQEITTHYWLTPLLAFIEKKTPLVQGEMPSLKKCFRFLCHLDNHMLGEDSPEDLSVRSRWFMEDPHRQADNLSFRDELEADLEDGTKFRHYWFYKLDFALWYAKASENQKNYWDQFRFTAKNSIEHISPQRPKVTDMNTVSEEWLNRFGNLALVSRGINSEYGNLAFNEKQRRYINKLQNERRPESLKMDLIYRKKNWNDTIAKKHHDEMLRVLSRHYDIDFRVD